MNSTKSIVVLLFAAMTSAVVTSNSHAQLFRNRGGGGTARNSIRRGPMMPPVPPMIRRVRSANGANTTNSSSGRQRIIRRDSAPASSNVTYQSTPTIVTTPTVRTAPATQPHQTYRVVSPSPTLAPAPPTAGTANSRAPSGQVEEARQLVKQARRYFELQRYQDAVSVVNQVCDLVPSDSNAFQFRSFIHFAMGNFEQAAADAYDALSLGDCWNWNAVYDVYGNAATYESQLRKLEQSSQKNPSMASHFLLGYQYVVLGHYSRAKSEFKQVLKTTPGEPLALEVIEVLTRLESPAPADRP